jgi:twitching motility protein PilT
MKEIILGLGHQTSLWNIVQTADEQLRSIHGSPKKMVVRSGALTVEAHRPTYDGPFDSFVFRLSNPSSNSRTILNDIVAENQSLCQVEQDDEQIEVRLTAEKAEDVERVHLLCDKLSTAFVLREVWRVHGEEYRTKPISQEALFKAQTKFKASDIHLYPGSTPVFRIDSKLRHSDHFDTLSSQQIFDFIKEMASEKHFQEFLSTQQCSFIYHQVGLGYARVSAFMKAGTPHCTLRFLPEKIPTFEDLAIPAESMQKLGKLHFGLVLVTGMTGSGKSTTVASLVDWINQNNALHILCIEQPVEFVHKSKKSVVSQRDVGEDVENFADAVRGALRHDPDVIVIGEMRDPDTIRSAINAAATGHLVISTLHSGTAYEAVNRIVSFFEPVERDLVKLQLRDALKCVICQRLLPKRGGGRQVGLEFLFNDTNIIANAILQGNSLGLKVGMQQTSSASFIFERHLFDLFKANVITQETAQIFSSDRTTLDQMILGSYSIPTPDAMLHAR